MATGGRVPSLEFIKNCRSICNENNAKLHVDGARFFNACISMNCEPKDIA
jgi:threonine aldolase